MAKKKNATVASKAKEEVTPKASPAQAQAQAPKEASKMTAAQRLEALENIAMQGNQKFEVLADEIDRLRTVIGGLNKRLNAVISAAEGGSLTADSVNKIIIDKAVKELEDKVTGLAKAGVLTKVDDNKTLITDRSFVVGREVDAEGNELNPRVQFALGSIDPSLRDKILGHKLGDLIPLSDGANIKSTFEVTELYSINEMKKEKEFKEPNPEAAGTEAQPK